jgi:hypothetical protein
LKDCETTLGTPGNPINYFTQCENLTSISLNISYSDGVEICSGDGCQIDSLSEQDKNSIDLIKYHLEYLNPDGFKRAVLSVQISQQQPPKEKKNTLKADSTFKELTFEVNFVNVSYGRRIFKSMFDEFSLLPGLR